MARNVKLDIGTFDAEREREQARAAAEVAIHDRKRHLDWCKDRALAYLSPRHIPDVYGAVASMTSDLRKHEAFNGPAYASLMLLGLTLASQQDAQGVRRWIEGFN